VSLPLSRRATKCAAFSLRRLNCFGLDQLAAAQDRPIEPHRKVIAAHRGNRNCGELGVLVGQRFDGAANSHRRRHQFVAVDRSQQLQRSLGVEGTRQIAINAGEDGSIVVGKISENDTYAYGYDAQEGEYGDLVSKGIKSRSRKSAQGDKWSFCLTAGTLWPANQERP
jgi:hypothetical protein